MNAKKAKRIRNLVKTRDLNMLITFISIYGGEATKLFSEHEVYKKAKLHFDEYSESNHWGKNKNPELKAKVEEDLKHE